MEFTNNPRQLGEDVKTLFKSASSVIVIAPFITKAGLLPLIGVLEPGCRLDVVTRWEPLEIRAGVSDPMIIDDVEATGGEVRLLPRLHAKVYLAGETALVGSANPTGPGLGFTTPANIETLVVAAANDDALVRLFAIIEATSSRADLALAKRLVDYAATLPEVRQLASADDLGGAADWIPRTTVPSRVVECYQGSIDRDDYHADLVAINAPPGLPVEAFRTYVGLALQQGLIGKIYRECENLQQWHGVERMRKLLVAANVVADEDPLLTWRRLLNWFQYYLGTTDGFAGGFTTGR